MGTPLVEAGGSLDDFIQRVRDAWWKAFPYQDSKPRPWITDVFEDMVVCSEHNGDARKWYRVAMTVTDEKVEFADREQWQEVTLDYVEVGAAVSESIRVDLPIQLQEANKTADGTYDAVILVEGESHNGNIYTLDALNSAVSVFEGARLVADHESLDEARSRPEGSIHSVIGKVTGVKMAESNGKAALVGKVFISASENKIRTKVSEGILGDLSIHGWGVGKRNKDSKFVVESFQKHPYTNVAMVTVASAGGAVLNEARRDVVLEGLTDEQLKRVQDMLAPDAEKVNEGGTPSEVRQLQESSQGGEMPEELKEVIAERDRLLEENAKLFREVRTAQATRVIDDALKGAQNLPEAAVTRIRESLKRTVDEFATHGSADTEDVLKETVEAVIEAERDYVARLVPNGAVSGLTGLNESPDQPDTDQLDEALTAELNALMGR